MDEFRGGKLGRITLELPEDIDTMNTRKVEEEKAKKESDYKRKQNFKKK